MITSSLSATTRTATGKGANRKLRREQGLIPAVVYGKGTESTPISVDPEALREALKTEFKLNTIIDLSIDGKANHKVLLKEHKSHPVDPRILLHVDFLAIDPEQEQVFSVPITTTGTPPGLKRGGVLEFKRRHLTVACAPTKLPAVITLDVGEMDLGATIHVAEVDLPEGVRAIYEANYTILAVAIPTAVKKAMEEAAAEEAEGEGEGEAAAEPAAS